MNHYDRQGRPILDWRQWAELIGDDEYRIVAQEQIGPYCVSTIWLGLDHGFGRGLEPLIFETMVFGPGGHSDDLEQERYSTEADAHAGHARYVQLYRSKAHTQ